jgi:hypothetical protein
VNVFQGAKVYETVSNKYEFQTARSNFAKKRIGKLIRDRTNKQTNKQTNSRKALKNCTAKTNGATPFSRPALSSN